MRFKHFLSYRKSCTLCSSFLAIIILSLVTLSAIQAQSTNMTAFDQKSFNNKSNTTKEFKFKKPKESAPFYSYAAWDNWGKICLLLKLDAMFTVTYETNYGKQQLINILPLDSEMKGRCANVLDADSVMDITWKGGFMFRIVFEKYRQHDTWGVRSMDFVYNTGDTLFDGAARGEERVATISDPRILSQFVTPLGKSYLCPSPNVLNLKDDKTGETTVIIRLSNVQMQAFDITAGKFSPVAHCGMIGFASGLSAPFGKQSGDSDGVQMVVFTITIMCSILTVLGYALYRSWFVKRVEYGTMIY